MNILTRILLTPFSAMYGFVTSLRNILFDVGFLKSVSFDVPVICVGNATVGGTGKTPHSEYIVSILSKKYRVAVLSRGYKRSTSGFILADEHATAKRLGDEPMQMHKKFPEVIVACCENRVKGIRKLLQLPEPPDVIVLDDAYQHRYVKAGMNILLCDYNRPIYRDKMLPLGRLRESCKSAVHRATHVIVTKCPDTLTPIDKRVIMTSLEMYPFQQLFYSKIGYGMPTKLSGEGSQVPFADWLKEVYASGASLLIVSGIASPKPFLKQIYNYFPDRHKVLNFNDHHKYCNSDLERISNELNKLSDGPKYIITTEKDAVKLSELKLPEWSENLFYVPIVVDFMQDKSILSEAVLDYVAENRAKR